MAQQVQSIPNSNFTVSPLTTVAGTIVSRRRVKVSCNQATTYTHLKAGGLSEPIFDIADNECFLDLQKMVFVADMKLTWPTTWPAPSFDGSSQTLFFKVSIGSQQGLKIEELNEYGLMSNHILAYTESALHREHNLLEYTDYIKRSNKAKDGSNFYDSGDGYIATGQFVANKWNRIHIRIHHSSFLNRARFLPLFLFRNGIRFEFIFEDVQKVFTIQHSPSFDSMCKFTNELYYKNSPNKRQFFMLPAGGAVPVVNVASVRGNISYNNRLFVGLGVYYEIKSRLLGFYGVAHKNGAADAFPDWIIPIYIQQEIDGVYKTVFAGTIYVDAAELNKTSVGGGGAGVIDQHIKSVAITDAGVPTVNNLADLTALDGLTYTLDNPAGTFPYAAFPARQAMPNWLVAGKAPTIVQNVHQILYIDFNNKFQQFAGAINLSRHNLHPGLLYTYGADDATINAITYEVKNIEMLLDLVKPAADDFLKFQQAFQSPTGIPYQYKRPIYKTRTIDYTGGSSVTQLPLDISVRSLTSLLITLQDPLSGVPAQDNMSAFIYPHLTSFLRRGLQRAEVVVGGQIYPIYPLLFRKDGDGGLNNWNEAHILEAENVFGVVGNAGFTPSFSRASFDTTRNYKLLSHLGQTDAQFTAIELANAPTSFFNVFDSSSFILAMSLAKDDLQQFATGIDTSQSGQISLNLYWNTLDPFAPLGTRIKVNIFAFCDAVFTLQNDANLVRY
jgi:hypothetical protein